MSNNVTLSDYTDTPFVAKTTDNAGVHTPHYNIDTLPSTPTGTNVIGGTFPAPATITASTVSIANAANATNAITLSGQSLTGLVMPSALTGTSIAIHGSTTLGGTYSQLYDASNVGYAITFTASRYYYIDPLVTLGWPYIKLVSTATESAQRDFSILIRPV